MVTGVEESLFGAYRSAGKSNWAEKSPYTMSLDKRKKFLRAKTFTITKTIINAGNFTFMTSRMIFWLLFSCFSLIDIHISFCPEEGKNRPLVILLSLINPRSCRIISHLNYRLLDIYLQTQFFLRQYFLFDKTH